jgi:hypothetical protein
MHKVRTDTTVVEADVAYETRSSASPPIWRVWPTPPLAKRNG